MSMPVGTVVAYAGQVANADLNCPNPYPVDGGNWLLCNGAIVNQHDYPHLYDAIGTAHGDGSDDPGMAHDGHHKFNLPDYRGLFLRGVAGNRNDRDPNTSDHDRHCNHPNGNIGNLVGSVQGDTTKMPNVPFTNAESGEHRHQLNFEINASRAARGEAENDNTVASPHLPTSPQPFTDNVGNHTHTIHGGDLETRPKNANVHWIIKAKE